MVRSWEGEWSLPVHVRERRRKGGKRKSIGAVLIVSGPVGAGKTTVCRELVASAPGPSAYIEGDRFWSFIVRPAPQQAPNDGFRMIMRAMLAAARHYARDGYVTIVDFTIPPWYLEAAKHRPDRPLLPRRLPVAAGTK